MEKIIRNANYKELMAILANAHLTYHANNETKALRRKCLVNLHRLPSVTGEPAVDNYGVLYGRREPVTEHEIKHLKLLSQYAKQIDGAAWCSGVIHLDNPEPAIFYYTKEGETTKKGPSRDLPLNASPEAFEVFHSSCEPSAHGQGKELVYDESYRLARELRPNKFGLNFDSLEFTNNLVDTIGVACSMPIVVSLYKLNSYTTGGFFRSHKDTPKATNHVGTLVIALPTEFSGGEFILRHKRQEAKFDWSSKKQKENPGGLNWVFFYSDIEHEILPVKSGHRLTLSYDVYRKPGDMDYRHDLGVGPMPALDASTLPLFACLSCAISDPLFLPDGGRLAIGLEHEYPLTSNQWNTSFKEYLKGTDATFMKVFEKMEVPFEVVAVHEVDTDYLPERYVPRYVGDGVYEEPEVNVLDQWGSHQKGHSLISGTTYQVFRDAYMEEEKSYERYVCQADHLNLDETLIWVRDPGKFVESVSYAAYGNEPTTKTQYVACAFIVTIPPFGDGDGDEDGERGKLRNEIVAKSALVDVVKSQHAGLSDEMMDSDSENLDIF